MRTDPRKISADRDTLIKSLEALNHSIIQRCGLSDRIRLVRAGHSTLDDYGESDLVSTEQAARILNVGAKTLQNWRVSGHPPAFVKIGARVLYRVGELRAVVADGARSSTSQRPVSR